MRTLFGIFVNLGLAAVLVIWGVAFLSEWKMTLGTVTLMSQTYHVLPWLIYGIGVVVWFCFLASILKYLPSEEAHLRWPSALVLSPFWFVMTILWFVAPVVLIFREENRQKKMDLLRRFLFLHPRDPVPKEQV